MHKFKETIQYYCPAGMLVAVFGCADLLLTDDNAVVTRLGDTAVIRCSDPDEVFVLTCTGGQWIGTQQVNCSTGSSCVSSISILTVYIPNNYVFRSAECSEISIAEVIFPKIQNVATFPMSHIPCGKPTCFPHGR